MKAYLIFQFVMCCIVVLARGVSLSKAEYPREVEYTAASDVIALILTGVVMAWTWNLLKAL